jgi:PAS domain S-box-containing protein
MKKQTNPKTDSEVLRQKAEGLLKKKLLKTPLQNSDVENIKLLHELRLYQSELESQNEELMLSKEIAATGMRKYAELFDFAPLGYLALSKTGEIIEINQLGSLLLGKEREGLVNSRFGFFISNDTKPVYNLFLEKVFSNNNIESCKVTISIADNIKYVILTGQAIHNGEQCLVTVADITEFRITEDALEQESAQRHILFEQSPDGILIIDPVTAKILDFNNAAHEQLGYSREEFGGLSIHDIEAMESKEETHIRISEVMRDGKAEFETMQRTKNGEIRNVSVKAQIIQINGDPVYYSIWRDVTDQIQASEALRLSEERQRFILDSLPVAIFTSPVNPEIDTSWISGNVKSITGFEAAEYLSENDFWRKRIHPEDREFVLNAYANLSGRAENLSEYRWKCSDGVYRWFQDRSILLENEYRKEFLGVIIDITERKTADIILKESEVKFRSLVETTNDVIWETNKEGLYTYLSPQIKDFLGYESQELVGHSPFEYMPDDESEVIRKISDDIIASRRSFNGLINVNLHKDGRRIIFETSGVPNFDSNNNYIGYRGIDRDITERKRAEKEINLLNTVLEERVKQRTFQLENANKELDAFAYSVSHNLRSPLRGIDGWSMALLEDYNHLLDEQGRTYLARVRNEAQQMANLIDDLLKLARVSRVERLLNDVDLSGLVQTISNQFILANPKRVFEFIIEPGLAVSGDLSMLQIVLTNLLDNACKYTGQNPVARIEFGKQLHEGKAVFFIRDNGVGFNMKNSKNLFGAFQRMHKPSEYPGSGIGLATVHRIITRHGGRIWAESKPGEGAVFYFTIS